MTARSALAALLTLSAIGAPTAAPLAVPVVGANAWVLAAGATGGQPPPSDAIIVLGAGVRPDGTPSDVLRDRLTTAAELYARGVAPRVLVSGDHGRAGYDELGPSRAYLQAVGVPDDAIFLDHAGFDTYSTFWRARRVFGITRATVVTQQFHLPRALFHARAEGLDAEGVVADRHRYVFAYGYAAREVLSRTAAAAYVLLGRRPRVIGASIPLTAGGHSTHDAHP